MFIDHCQAQKIGRKWCAKPEITNCAPATSKLYIQIEPNNPSTQGAGKLMYPAGPICEQSSQVQICNISRWTYIIGNRYIHEICYIAGWIQKKKPKCKYVIYPAEPMYIISMDVYYWYTHGICYISGQRQKKTPKCSYVIYPAGPTLLVYTWNLPYIQPEAKKPPQVQICNISGRMQKKPPRCRYVIYPAGCKKTPPGADM
jgi:hypothetical protein